MAFIHLYKGTVTAGGTDGTQVSEGTGASTIAPPASLNSAINEESPDIKFAARCDTGYTTTGNTIITPVGKSTTLTNAPAIGATVITVSDISKVQAKVKFRIGTGGTAEDVVIASIDGSNNITLAAPLTYAHIVGETIQSQSHLKWSLGLTNTSYGVYGQPLTVTSTINATNTLLYAKCKATSDESPVNDTTVQFQIATAVQAG